MERPSLAARRNRAHARRVRHAENAALRLIVGRDRRAHDGDGLAEQELQPEVRVQVERREEDGLGRVRVDLRARARRQSRAR